MPRATLKEFGVRLTQMRQSRGWSQTELGRASGISRRMIAYYERDNSQPPGAIVVKLAKALNVTTDELLGVRSERKRMSPAQARLVNRLKRVEELPPSDRRALLKHLDLLLSQRRSESDRDSRVA